MAKHSILITINPMGNNRRNKKTDSFVQLPRHLIKSKAYRALKPISRAMFVEFLYKYIGNNNGEIFMSVRMAAELLSCANNTAQKAIKDLIDKGFIIPRLKGSFTLKQRHATEWIVTLHGYNNQIATKEYMKWTPPK
tara:strand:- start:153 stop:563 length:411 start_codon:yes stop_codon:yes gene_type:complete